MPSINETIKFLKQLKKEGGEINDFSIIYGDKKDLLGTSVLAKPDGTFKLVVKGLTGEV